ncbi:hypothetical protein VB779_16955 [Haloarculaceae archaeon H-GB11]|nr:hypothetical protein [Haloarculaceae archaeon H-GB11]
MTTDHSNSFEHSEGNPTNGRASEDGENVDVSALRAEIASDSEPGDEADTNDAATTADDADGGTDPIAELGLSGAEVPTTDDVSDEEPDDGGVPAPAADRATEDEPPVDGDEPDGADGNGPPGADGDEPDVVDGDGPPGADGDEPDVGDGDGPSGVRTDPDGVVSALLEELERRELTDAERSALASGLGLETPNSLSARLRHLQEAVDDVAAYRSALEEFIDDNGDATAIIDDFESRFDDLSDRIDLLEGHLDDLRADVESIEERQRTGISAIEERTEELESSLDEALETLEADVAELRVRVAEGEQWRADLSDVFRTQGDEAAQSD